MAEGMQPAIGDRFVPVLYFGLFVFIPLALLHFEGLSSTSKLLWGRIALYLGKDGKAYPTQARLSKDIGITKRSVARSLKQLADAGFLEMEPGTGRRPTQYHLLFHEIFIDPALNKPKGRPPQTLTFNPPPVPTRADKNVHPAPVRADKDVYPKGGRGGQVVPLRGDTNVYQKKELLKENKEEKKESAPHLTHEQQEWASTKLALDVFSMNLSGHDREARSAEVVKLAAKDIGPTIETLNQEIEIIERRIQQFGSKSVRSHMNKHLKNGTLTIESLERFEKTHTRTRANG